MNLTRLVSRFGLAALSRRVLARRGIFVLEFHGVAGRRWPGLPGALQPSLTAAELRAILGFVRRRFDFLSPAELFAPESRGVLLSFDDGFANNFDQALPVLEELAAPAVFFVTLSHVLEPGRRLPWIAEALSRHGVVPAPEMARDLFDGADAATLRQAAAHPLITIGGHGWHHPRLTGCDGAALATELGAARERLAEVVGRAVELFAYPFGDYDARVLAAVEAAGFKAAFAEDCLALGTPRFEIPRVGIYSSDATYLDLKLSGLHRRPVEPGSLGGPLHG